MQLMEQVVERGNMWRADERVMRNKGAPGADGMPVGEHHVKGGRGWVADIDLAKFFDRVNHDVLMARVAREVGDGRVLGVIRRFLEAGLMCGRTRKHTRLPRLRVDRKQPSATEGRRGEHCAITPAGESPAA